MTSYHEEKISIWTKLLILFICTIIGASAYLAVEGRQLRFFSNALQSVLAKAKPKSFNTHTAFTAEKIIERQPEQSTQPIRKERGNLEKEQESIHYPYQEIRSNLVKVGMFYDVEVFLDHEAAAAYLSMQEAAKKEGVLLQAASGFRSHADQQILFAKQIKKLGSKKKASRLSAPPGFSEHHTGYAIDIVELNNDKNILTFSFDQTDAFRWLKRHAANYGFEMSFPMNNPMGVSYEPWHWRFVGSARAANIFALAREEVSSLAHPIQP